MVIEVIGPPAVGKTTFLETLAPSMMIVDEPLLELNSSGFLPSQPGVARQKAVIDHALTQLTGTSDETALIDSGVIYLLAFGQLRFNRDPELARLFQETEAATRLAKTRFSGIIRLNAPMSVLEKHKSTDSSRQRRHFQQNLLDFASISRLVDELIREIGSGFLFDVENTEETDQTEKARRWALSRSSHLPMAEVVAAAKKAWHSPRCKALTTGNAPFVVSVL